MKAKWQVVVSVNSQCVGGLSVVAKTRKAAFQSFLTLLPLVQDQIITLFRVQGERLDVVVSDWKV